MPIDYRTHITAWTLPSLQMLLKVSCPEASSVQSCQAPGHFEKPFQQAQEKKSVNKLGMNSGEMHINEMIQFTS